MEDKVAEDAPDTYKVKRLESSQVKEAAVPDAVAPGIVGSGTRKTSAKFASLKATFERDGASPNGGFARPKRRTTGSSQGSDGGRERVPGDGDEEAPLKYRLEKEKELRVVAEEKMAALMEENADLKKRILRLETDHGPLAEAAKQVGTALNDKIERVETEETVDAMDDSSLPLDGITGPTQEASVLRRQLSDMKRSIAKSKCLPSHISDMALREELSGLQHEVQNWVVHNYRRSKVRATPTELCQKLQSLAEPCQDDAMRLLYQNFQVAHKLATYQANVAYLLNGIFRDEFFFALKEGKWAEGLVQASKSFRDVLSQKERRTWQARTYDALCSTKQWAGSVESVADDMSKTICQVLDAMAEVEEGESKIKSLKFIVKRIISVADTVHAQLDEYVFLLPEAEDPFDEDYMEDVSEEEDVHGDRTLRCCIFPGLYKADDHHSDLRWDPERVIFRAKVLCIDSEDDR